MQLPAQREVSIASNQILFEATEPGKIQVPKKEQLIQRTALETRKILENYDNKLSDAHLNGISKIANLFGDILLGGTRGRISVPMPTGSGKTTAITGLCVALEQLQINKTVAVCAEKVEALCELKRALIKEGIPEHDISLIHSYTHDPQYNKENPKPGTASEQTVADFSRPIVLLTHEKVKGKKTPEELLSRDLVIWDEGLLKAEGVTLKHRDIFEAIEAWKTKLTYQRKWGKGQDNAATDILSRHLADLGTSLDQVFRETATNDYSLWAFPPLTLPVSELKREVDRFLFSEEKHAKVLKQILERSGDKVRALTTKQGNALVDYFVTIPEGLENVVVLDASYPLRELVHWDESISVIDPGFEKDYSDVSIHVQKGRSGRSFIEEEFSKGADNKVSAEVVEIIKQQLEQDPEGGFLVFTYKARKVDVPGKLKKALKDAGIDTEKEISPGKKQINILTWGSETSLNDFADCNNVIFAGVLHLPHEEVAARALGQAEDLKRPLTGSEVASIHLGEQVHRIYQALSRGSCRHTVDGKARKMNAWLFHDELEAVKERLSNVMPGVSFLNYRAKHLSRGTTLTELTGNQIIVVLDELKNKGDIKDGRVSAKKVKEEHSKRFEEVHPKQFQRAGKWITKDRNGWMRVNRSFVHATYLD